MLSFLTTLPREGRRVGAATAQMHQNATIAHARRVQNRPNAAKVPLVKFIVFDSVYRTVIFDPDRDVATFNRRRRYGVAMDPVVEVAGGRVRGAQRDGVLAFFGIPYARSPEGSLRWRPPQPVEPWSGVRDATEFGPIAPQPPPVPGMAIPGDPDVQDEDCLNLNVWTPALDAKRRPVMVWIHGGGFTSGSGSGIIYRGGRLSGENDVVVVTINYRIGALGFLAHPALALDGGPGTTGGLIDTAGTLAGATGNWGLMDQVAALCWVRDHILDFGGDPSNVTIFGESAGGMSISALLGVPAARGLFHKAIIESGPFYTHSLERAVKTATELAGELGIKSIDRSSLENVPVQELVDVVKEIQDRLPAMGELPLPFLPVVDRVFIPRPIRDQFVSGEVPTVPIMIGTTRDELSLFAAGDPQLNGLDDEGLVERVRYVAPGIDPLRAVDSYRAIRTSRGEPVSPRDLWVAMGTDHIFRSPSLKMASMHRNNCPSVYVYLFTWESPVFGGMLGSCHALEIPFVFGCIDHPAVRAFSGSGPDAEALSMNIQRAWSAFARNGDPSHEGIGQWAPWDPEKRVTGVLGRETSIVEAPRNEELEVWEDLRSWA